MAQPVRPKVSSAVVASVSSDSANPVTLVAANSSRTALIVHNDSTAILYIKFGSAASTISHTTQVVSQGTFTMNVTNSVYTGIVTGIWASTNGAARVTEY